MSDPLSTPAPASDGPATPETGAGRVGELEADRTEAVRLLYDLVVEAIGEERFTELGAGAAYAEALQQASLARQSQGARVPEGEWPDMARQALEQARDRLQWVDNYRRGEASRVPSVNAALALVEKALAASPSPNQESARD